MKTKLYKALNIFLILTILLSLTACGEKTKDEILGKWYGAPDYYVELQSDNTYKIVTTIDGNKDIAFSGEWKYLEEEELYKLYFEDMDDIETTITSDEYGKNIILESFGTFYKGEFPEKLLENSALTPENESSNVQSGTQTDSTTSGQQTNTNTNATTTPSNKTEFDTSSNTSENSTPSSDTTSGNPQNNSSNPVVSVPETDSSVILDCPNFVGQKVETVFSNTNYTNNFRLEQKWEHNSKYAYGTVYKQSETAGKKLEKYTVITLYISMGSENLNIPDLQGETEAVAVSKLKALGLKVTVKTEKCVGIDKGLVVRIVPKDPNQIVKGSEVTLFISSGK